MLLSGWSTTETPVTPSAPFFPRTSGRELVLRRGSERCGRVGGRAAVRGPRPADRSSSPSAALARGPPPACASSRFIWGCGCGMCTPRGKGSVARSGCGAAGGGAAESPEASTSSPAPALFGRFHECSRSIFSACASSKPRSEGPRESEKGHFFPRPLPPGVEPSWPLRPLKEGGPLGGKLWACASSSFVRSPASIASDSLFFLENF
mmetsp:Transcript_40191/g.69341  ORF Transcript_40191/g.69341 Transcript_40191/m.69341 type:complete len:207 (-) Transcript_40191:320-940(-)